MNASSPTCREKDGAGGEREYAEMHGYLDAKVDTVQICLT